MEIEKTKREIHQTAINKGWWDKPRSFGDIIALCHSELSEALEAYRNGELDVSINKDGKPEGVPVELADVIIRIMDYFGHMNWNLELVLDMKMSYNKNRPYRHGNKLL